jgi:radical SAM superfamily enzyme YgiQ (UPF0313 family)
MHYEGPIYRPPSEAGSLLVQATVGCPWNRCTFCMVYKNGPPYRERSLADICRDLDEAYELYGDRLRTLFFPAGNTIAMRTERLAAVCAQARKRFPRLERITVYGSSQYIQKKGPEDLKRLADAGLTRIHLGLESGDDTTLRHIRKGADSAAHIQAGRWTIEAGLELSLYVMLGIAGKSRSMQHARATAAAINAIAPHFIRLRTFVPKINTPLLAEIEQGRFQMIGPHEVLRETLHIVEAVDSPSQLASDHYTNYVNIEGHLPADRERLIRTLKAALTRDEASFRPFFVGNQ